MSKLTDNTNALFARVGFDRSFQTGHLIEPALEEITNNNGITREALALTLDLTIPHTNAVLMVLEEAGKIRRQNGLWELQE